MQFPVIGFKPFTKKEVGLVVATGLLNAVATSALAFGAEALESAVAPEPSSGTTAHTPTPQEAARQAAANSVSEAAVDYHTDALQEGAIRYGIKGVEKGFHAAAEHGAHKVQHAAKHHLTRHASMTNVLAPLDKAHTHTATASGLMFAEGASAAKLGFIIGSAIGTPAIGGPIGAGIAAFVNTIILATGARVMINNRSLGSYIKEYTDPAKHPGVHVLATTAIGAAYGSLLLPGVGSAIGAGVGFVIGSFYAFKNSETGKNLAAWFDNVGFSYKRQKQTGDLVAAGFKVGTGALFGFMLGGPIGAAIGAAATAGVLILAKAWQHFDMTNKVKKGFDSLKNWFSGASKKKHDDTEPLLANDTPQSLVFEKRANFIPMFGNKNPEIADAFQQALARRNQNKNDEPGSSNSGPQP